MANVTITLNDNDKEEFSKFCDEIGLSVSAAMNAFVKKTLSLGKIPFILGREEEVPNRATRKAIKEGEKILKHPEKYPSYNNIADAMEAMLK